MSHCFILIIILLKGEVAPTKKKLLIKDKRFFSWGVGGGYLVGGYFMIHQNVGKLVIFDNDEMSSNF